MTAPGTLHGVAASSGIAIGRARVLVPPVDVVDRRIARDAVPAEVARLREAVAATDAQLSVLSARLDGEHLHEGHLILEAHRMMLRDDEVVEGARRLIEGDGLAAECAVRRVIDAICARFASIEDAYLRERGADVEAIGERLLRTLLGLPELSSGASADGTIGVGHTLSPIDALHLPRSGLAGFAAEHGGKTSHAAIILQALGIPFVVGVRGLLSAVQPGDTLVVDGSRGEVIVRPDAATLAICEERRSRERARALALKSRVMGPTVTRDGVRIELAANIEAPSEVADALELGAESVGLFRTELLYLDRPELPGEEEQFQDAVAVLVALGGRPATFRTLDVGGEKLPLAITVAGGANPSLGVRAIRFSRRRPDVFRTQMRALYRASAAGPLRIMFPLVSGITELHEARRACAAIADELAGEGMAFTGEVPIGVMIETPSAALTTDHLAGQASFFSIGTNDLIQYTFAADRENEEVEYLYHPLHPALLRLLKSAIDGARSANRPIAVCGDMAGDPAFTWVLVGLGVRSLSMSPRFIPAVRSIIADSTLAEMEAMVAQALSLRSETEVEGLVLEMMSRRFPLVFGTPSVIPA
ncbi:MAG: phosphoenolpyruvate--protein phosphotransferase [Myxococcales bacterium]|nr:phosphoenolpyruvate--protein phosphotransferase [Myxococcales bacterium]